MKKTFLFLVATMLHVATLAPLNAAASEDIWDDAWSDVMRANEAQTKPSNAASDVDAVPEPATEEYYPIETHPQYNGYAQPYYDVARQRGLRSN